MPDAYWRGLDDEERGQLAEEMARRRMGSEATLRYVLGATGVMLVLVALGGFLGEMPTCLDKQDHHCRALAFNVPLLALGVLFVSLPIVWTSSQAAAKSLQHRRGPIEEATKRQKDLETLERMWKL